MMHLHEKSFDMKGHNRLNSAILDDRDTSVRDSQAFRLLSAASEAIALSHSPRQAAHELFQILQTAGVLWLELEFVDRGQRILYRHGIPSDANINEDACGRQCVFFVLKNQVRDVGRFRLECIPVPYLLDALPVLSHQLASLVSMRLMQSFSATIETRAKHRIQELASLYEQGKSVSPDRTDELLQRITERTCILMDAQACSVMLLDDSSGNLRVEASHGLSSEAHHATQRISEGLGGRVASTLRPMLITSQTTDHRLDGVLLRPEIGSSILVPMQDQAGRVLGVLSIRRERNSDDFTQEDLRLFSVFATQAAMAIANARLYRDLQIRADELQTLATLSRSLIENTEMDRLMHSVPEEVCRIVGFGRCGVLLLDTGNRALQAKFWSGYMESFSRLRVRLGDGPIGTVALSCTQQKFNAGSDIKHDSILMSKARGLARSLGTDEFVVSPMQGADGECIGVLVADNKGRRDSITPSQMSLLEAFAGQVGIAVENSRLYARMQDALANTRKLKDYTDLVLQSVDVAIISLDAQRRITRLNPATEKLLRVHGRRERCEDLRSLLNRAQLPEEEIILLLDTVDEVMHTRAGIPRRRIVLHPKSYDEIIATLLVSPLNPTGGELSGVVLLIEDTTEEAKMQVELERMTSLADFGQLAARMAHEVRNALSPIRAGAQMLQHDLKSLKRRNEWPEIILSEVDNLSSLTAEMLDFARQPALDIREIDVNSFLETSIQALSEIIVQNGVRITWQCEDNLPTLQADPARFGQVVRNLVVNAIQSMPQGGNITICTRATDDARIALSIIDEGVGIDSKNRERIFQPFVTTRTRGTGLGLPIVQKIVDQHGGNIIVESTQGKGSNFTIVMPFVQSTRKEHQRIDRKPIMPGYPGVLPDV